MRHLDIEARKAVAEGLVVLPREHRRWGDNGDLGPSKGGDSGGAQGHLRLSEADVADNKPVHRGSRAQIGDRCLDGALLIRGETEWEARGKPFVVAPRRDKLWRHPCTARV